MQVLVLDFQMSWTDFDLMAGCLFRSPSNGHQGYILYARYYVMNLGKRLSCTLALISLGLTHSGLGIHSSVNWVIIGTASGNGLSPVWLQGIT